MSVDEQFREHDLVPDVVDAAPPTPLQVVFDSATVRLGNELTPTQVKAQPQVSWEAADDSFYTLVFTDPDAPSRANPIRREFLHWLVGNIPGVALDKGQMLAEFLSSAPPKDSDFHRYTFLLYRQAGRIVFDEAPIPDTTREGRRCFSARKFAAKHGLLGPIAGNFYLAQWDDYVEEVNKKLMGT